MERKSGRKFNLGILGGAAVGAAIVSNAILWGKLRGERRVSNAMRERLDQEIQAHQDNLKKLKKTLDREEREFDTNRQQHTMSAEELIRDLRTKKELKPNELERALVEYGRMHSFLEITAGRHGLKPGYGILDRKVHALEEALGPFRFTQRVKAAPRHR